MRRVADLAQLVRDGCAGRFSVVISRKKGEVRRACTKGGSRGAISLLRNWLQIGALLRYAVQATDALAKAHQAGIVHGT